MENMFLKLEDIGMFQGDGIREILSDREGEGVSYIVLSLWFTMMVSHCTKETVLSDINM